MQSARTAVRRLCRPLSHQSHRTFHRQTGLFITRAAEGLETKRSVEIFVGDAHESYVVVEKEVGNELREAASMANAETVPLTYHRGSRQLAFGDSQLPRLVISQDLAVPPASKGEKSAATLWAAFPSDLITLDGTTDHDFAKLSHDSVRKLRPVVKQLKNR
ncbi:uncharacterized protein J3D65DRAFT_299754 [Phyllosticta citribraziliensis]|uniref:Uncharacterized protein n=1 Tax=Phyllosticta citribraziliensis TaxID=989973 RepID=A0ABR1M0K5_9PEZI